MMMSKKVLWFDVYNKKNVDCKNPFVHIFLILHPLNPHNRDVTQQYDNEILNKFFFITKSKYLAEHYYLLCIFVG